MIHSIKDFADSSCGSSHEGKKETIKTPSISVIIPVYNTGERLLRSVDSVLCQTKQDIEVIIVNDGSTDNSDEILRNIAPKDRRVVYLPYAVNRGQSCARNIGLLKATGDYVYFFDSDDYLQPHALEKLYGIARSDNLDILLFAGGSYYATPELKKKYPGYQTYYKKRGLYKGVYTGKELFPLLIENKDNAVSVYTMFIKRSLLVEENISFYEGVIYEDNLFHLQLVLSAKRVSVIQDELFVRTVREHSTMTSFHSKYSLESHFKVAVAMLAYATNQNLSKDSFDAVSRHIFSFCEWLKKRFTSGELKGFSCPNFPSNTEMFMAKLLHLYIQTKVNETNLQRKINGLQLDLDTEKEKARKYDSLRNKYLKIFPIGTKRNKISRFLVKKIIH